MTNPLNLNPDNLKALQEKSKEIERNMLDAQKKLLDMTVVGESGAGLVKITMNGRYEALNVFIDPSLLKESIKILEELVAAAITNASQKVGTMVQGEMAKLLGGLDLGKFAG